MLSTTTILFLGNEYPASLPERRREERSAGEMIELPQQQQEPPIQPHLDQQLFKPFLQNLNPPLHSGRKRQKCDIKSKTSCDLCQHDRFLA